MLDLAYKFLTLVWPLLYRAVTQAIDSDGCPADAVKAAMDSEEAAAILAEFEKFRRKS